ncbi:MAG: prolyl oligopeptidase family serine peptidase [Anaerolineae bacterium]|nr:prolyl oligopeptidase family serine peptidase [Anaerolineae bacterium]
MQEHSGHFADILRRTVSLDYLLYLPTWYTADETARFPLILFLHGTGERGADLERVKRTGLPARLAEWPDCPFVVLAPQCAEDSIWAFELDALHALLESVCDICRIDARRTYLTGLSLGGTGVWYLATRYPRRFAAVAPICGRGISRSLIGNLKDTPVWAFHGQQDSVVEPAESVRMVEALQKAGADARLTIYPDAGHDAWTATYANPALYDWFLSQRLDF